MKTTAVKFFTVIALAMSVGCGTTNPSKVPEFSDHQFKAFEFKSLTPRQVTLNVVNERGANKQSGNFAQVEGAVKDAFGRALSMSGVQVVPQANHALTVRIEDCNDAAEGAACIQMHGILKSPRSTIEAGGYTSNGYGRNSSQPQSFGDMDRAYGDAIDMVLEGLNKQLMKQSTGI